MLGECVEGIRRHTPATGVVGEIHLQQHIEHGIVLPRGGVERTGDPASVDRVHNGCRVPDGPGLVAGAVGFRTPSYRNAERIR